MFNFFMKKTLLAFSVSLLTLASAQVVTISDNGNQKRVGNVHWQKVATIDPQTLINQTIPANSASVFFIRPLDKDGLQTSANIAINDRFQVSLQPGNYSQVNSCVGINQISAEITGNKNNDLSKNFITFNLQPNTAYFFNIDVDNNGKTQIAPLTQERALQLMKDKHHQVHQISRVVPNCPPAAEPTTPPPAPIINDNLDNIELKVLFDTDKSFVKPTYYDEIKRVADYMQRHPNSTATIEGHTDSRASDKYNLALSQRRVDAVRKVLIEQFGIAGNRLNAIGYGESRPVASNDTEAGRQQNRRVIAIFQNN